MIVIIDAVIRLNVRVLSIQLDGDRTVSSESPVSVC